MEVKVEAIDACRKRVSVAVPAERVEKEIESAFDRLARTATVPGFRPGKAPRKVLELHYGGAVRDEVKDKLIEESFVEALRANSLSPAVPPVMDKKALGITRGAPFRYEVEVEVWPEFRLGSYTGIRATRAKEAVKDEQVESYLAKLLDRHAEFVPVEGRALASGDFALLDVAAVSGGTAVDEGKGVWIEVCEGAFLPGFAEKLAGMAPGEKRAFTLPLPPEYPREELRGKEAQFTVTLREIKQKRLPELNAEFCREVGDFAGPDELRAAIRADLARFIEEQAERGIVDQINNYLLENNAIPLPPSRVGAETMALAEKTAARLLSQGLKKEEILEKKEELMAASRREAEKMLRLSCIYGEIAKREKLAVGPEEIEERLGRIAAQLHKSAAEVRASLEKSGRLDGVGEDILREKVEGCLVKSAKIKDAKE